MVTHTWSHRDGKDPVRKITLLSIHFNVVLTLNTKVKTWNPHETLPSTLLFLYFFMFMSTLMLYMLFYQKYFLDITGRNKTSQLLQCKQV